MGAQQPERINEEANQPLLFDSQQYPPNSDYLNQKQQQQQQQHTSTEPKQQYHFPSSEQINQEHFNQQYQGILGEQRQHHHHQQQQPIIARLPGTDGALYCVDTRNINLGGKKLIQFPHPETGEMVVMTFKNETKRDRYLMEHLPCLTCGHEGTKKGKTIPKKVAIGCAVGTAVAGLFLFPLLLLVCWVPFVIPQAYKKKYRCRKCRARQN